MLWLSTRGQAALLRDGDALSTTCFAMGLEEGLELIRSLDGVEAVFVTKDGEMHTSSDEIELEVLE